MLTMKDIMLMHVDKCFSPDIYCCLVQGTQGGERELRRFRRIKSSHGLRLRIKAKEKLPFRIVTLLMLRTNNRSLLTAY